MSQRKQKARPTATRTTSGRLKHPSMCDCVNCVIGVCSYPRPVVPSATYDRETQSWNYRPEDIQGYV